MRQPDEVSTEQAWRVTQQARASSQICHARRKQSTSSASSDDNSLHSFAPVSLLFGDFGVDPGEVHDNPGEVQDNPGVVDDSLQ
mmetsp:Transcript_26980/g.49224  ORF Transcript_26980/g.49224 Transcript_26980/m.49224 type:complete len:84 (-) Transcript_26980:511-762(-)